MKDHIVYEHDGYKWLWWRKSWEDETGYTPTYYSTNRDGEGLFWVDLRKNSYKQLSGTCQFSIRGLKESSVRAKIRRLMNEETI